MGSLGHWNFKGPMLFLLEAHIQKTYVFFLFNCTPDNTPNELTIFMTL